MKTSILSIVFLICVLLITPQLLTGQSFTVEVTPNAQSVSINETATYSIHITPLNGFNATVYLSVVPTSFKGKIAFSTTTPNPPYENITLKISPTFKDTGSLSFTVSAKNSGVEANASCQLSVASNTRWTSVEVPQKIYQQQESYRSLRLDNEGNACLAHRKGNTVFINHYRNKHWETDSINIQVNSFLLPFIYDKTNILWFGTQEGIVRYDGKFTTIYNSSNSNLIGNNIIDILKGDNGFPICMATDSNSNVIIARYDGSVWQSKIVSAQRPNENFCIDSSNRILIPFTGGIYKIEDSTQEFMKPRKDYYPQFDISKVICDKDGGIWCMYWYMPGNNEPYTKIALSYYNGTEWTQIPNPTLFTLKTFFIDDDKNVWMTSAEGLHRYNGSTWTTYNKYNALFEDPGIYYMGSRQVVQDKNKNIWVVSVTNYVEIVAFNPNGLVDVTITPNLLSVEEQPEATDGITIYPNPTNTNFTISGTDNILSVKLMNSLGMEISRTSSVVSGTSSVVSGTVEMDVKDLASGIYFVQLLTATGMITKSIVVNR